MTTIPSRSRKVVEQIGHFSFHFPSITASPSYHFVCLLAQFTPCLTSGDPQLQLCTYIENRLRTKHLGTLADLSRMQIHVPLLTPQDGRYVRVEVEMEKNATEDVGSKRFPHTSIVENLR